MIKCLFFCHWFFVLTFESKPDTQQCVNLHNTFVRKEHNFLEIMILLACVGGQWLCGHSKTTHHLHKWFSSASSTQHLEFAPTSVTSCKSPMAVNRKENSMPTPSFTGAVPLPLLKWWIFFSASPDLLRMTPFCLLERAPNLELWIVFKIVVRNTAPCIKIFWNLALPYSQMDACWQVSVTLSGIVPSVFCLKVS